MMKEILDSDLVQKPALTSRDLNKRSFIYLTIMILGGIGLSYAFGISGGNYLLIYSFSVLSSCLTLGFFLEGIRWFWNKNKKPENRKTRNPFWFEWIENSFSIWLLFGAFILVRIYLV